MNRSETRRFAYWTAVAIAVGAIRAGYRVLVRSTFDLVQDCAEAKAAGQRRAFVQTLTRVDRVRFRLTCCHPIDVR